MLAVVKHWVFNSQETNRGTENSVVDEKTSRDWSVLSFVKVVW